MAQTNYTPIQLYYSTTASAVPTSGNLANGELGLNIADMKLYAKNSAGVVTLLASNAATSGVSSFQTSLSGLTPSTSTTGAVTLAGTLGTANGGTNLTSFTSGGVVYASSTSALATGSALTFNGTVLTLGTSAALPITGSKFSIGNDANSALRLAISNQNAGASALVGIDFEPAGGGWKIDVPSDTSGFVPPMYFKAGASTNVTFAYGGNVGIGTTSPAAKLDVTTATAGFATILTNTNGATDSNGLYIKAGTGATEYNLRLSNTSGSTDFMAVKGNGNVGIGTTSPKEILDSRGAAVFSGDNATGTNAYGTASGILLSTSSDNTTARITAVSNGANSVILTLRSLSSGSAVNVLTLASSGAVGVGDTPSYGTAGQVLTSGGSGAAPTWAAAAGGISTGKSIAMAMIFGF